MNLKEFEGKSIFKDFGIPIPESYLVKDPEEAYEKGTEILKNSKFDVVVLKAQILSGKRGKSGGILFPKKEEIEENAKEIFGKTFKGYPVNELLVEEKGDIQKEYYFSITVDRNSKRYTLIFSEEGGMEIEEIAEKFPEKILKYSLNPGEIDQEELGKFFGEKSSLDTSIIEQLVDIVEKSWKIVQEKDATLIEINPLTLTTENKLIALDSKVVIDDNALFRQEDFQKYQKREQTGLEEKAAEAGVSYIELDGDIAVIGNGAGLTMATLDIVKFFGGEPANFLDIGGGANNEIMNKALEVALSKDGLKAIFVNVFGGITRCDDVAKGIVEYKENNDVDVKMVVRLVGTNEEEGIKILEENGIKAFENMEKAAKEVCN